MKTKTKVLVPYNWEEPTLMYTARCPTCGLLVAFITLEAVKLYPVKVPLFATHNCPG